MEHAKDTLVGILLGNTLGSSGSHTNTIGAVGTGYTTTGLENPARIAFSNVLLVDIVHIPKDSLPLIQNC